MGKVVNVTTLHDEWLKEVKIDLITHSRWTGDTVPPVLLNFPAHGIAPKLARGHNGGSNNCQTTRNEMRQGRSGAGSAQDRNGGEPKCVCAHLILHRATGQVVLPPPATSAVS
jgi:hypothetical protein